MCLTAKIGYRHTASLARSKGASKALPTDGRLASKTDRPELLLEYTDAMSSSRLLQRVPSSSAPVPSPAISHTALLGVEPEAARQVRVIVQQSAERPLHPLDRQQFPAGVIGKRLRLVLDEDVKCNNVTGLQQWPSVSSWLYLAPQFIPTHLALSKPGIKQHTGFSILRYPRLDGSRLLAPST